MHLLTRLAEVALVGSAGRGRTSLEDVLRGCALVREGLGAEEVYVLQATDPHFTKLGDETAPTGYEIKQKGYWIMRRALAGAPARLLAGFVVKERRVMDGFDLQPGLAASHVGLMLGTNEASSDMAIARGPFPKGLTPEQVDFLVAARSSLAALVASFVDADRASRMHQQFGALSELASALGQAERLDDVLPAIATSLSRISGFPWILICLVDEPIEKILEVAQNVSRYGKTDVFQTDPYYSDRAGGHKLLLSTIRQLTVSRRPTCHPDVFAPGSPGAHPALRSWFERAHVFSLSTFPILFKDRTLGSITFASSTPRALEKDEMTFLQDLVTQASVTIKAVTLQRELAASEARYRRLTEESAEGIIILQAGVIRFANSAAARLLGYARPTDAVGQPVAQHIAPEHREAALARIEARLQGDTVLPATNEFEALRRDGSRFVIAATETVVEWEEAPSTRVSVLDITERRRREAAEQEAANLRSVAMLANATAHELNNPLTVVAGNLQLLGADLGDRPKSHVHVERAKRGIQRITDMIRHMQSITRLEPLQGLDTAGVPTLDLSRSSAPTPGNAPAGDAAEAEPPRRS